MNVARRMKMCKVSQDFWRVLQLFWHSVYLAFNCRGDSFLVVFSSCGVQFFDAQFNVLPNFLIYHVLEP